MIIDKDNIKLILIILVVSLGIGYAYINSDLNINGTAKIKNANWDVHWANVQVSNGSVTGTNVVTAPTIDTNQTTVAYSIVLPTPGTYYEFTVDAVNAGSIDAMIDTIDSKLNGATITTLPAYLEYTVTYGDGTVLEPNHELKANTTETYKVKIKYRDDIELTQIPATDQTLSLQFTVTYRQANENSKPIVNPVSFAEDDWSTIIKAVKKGKTENYNVGDTKEIDMGTFGTHTLRIANKSTPAECSTEGFSQTACGFVLEFVDIITNHNMNSTSTNVGGWPATEMRTYVNNDIYNSLPTDLKKGIISTTVVSGHGATTGETNFTSIDKLYLPSTKELNFDMDWDSAKTTTRVFDYYLSHNSSSDRGKKYNGSSVLWWIRTASINGLYFGYVPPGGNPTTSSASISYGVSPAFRIG